MKSMWIWLSFVRPRSSSSRRTESPGRRDVARRVLVEQRVVEDGAELADPALASTSATSPSRAAPSSVASTILEIVPAVLVPVQLGGPAALEAHLQLAHDRPVYQHERLRRGDIPVGALRIGGCEDLLGREVRHVANAVDVVEVARLATGSATVRPQIGARALQARARRSAAR